MQAILNYHGTEYYRLSDRMKQVKGHQYIFQRKDISDRLFVFHGITYVDDDTWKLIEQLIEIDEHYYSAYALLQVMDYTRDDSETVVLEPIRKLVPPVIINGAEYFKRTAVDALGNLSGVYSKLYGTRIIFGGDLVRYHNNPDNRLYHKGNLYISEYHLQFIYPKRSLLLINGKLCIRSNAADIYADFTDRCQQSTELDYFDNYFDGITKYPETRRLMRKFYTLRLNSSKSQAREQVATYLLEKLYYLFGLLRKELHLYTYSEVESVILADPDLSGIKDIVHFLNYVKREYPDFMPEIEELSMKSDNLTTDFKTIIFSEEEFAAIYDAAIDIPRHVAMAYDDPAYAQYWLYILVLLSNFTRQSDITNLPILTLQQNYPDGYFCSHDILPADAESICDLYETQARSQLIGKNQGRKRIYIMEEQKAALAIAFVIAIQHAQNRNLSQLFSMKQIGSDRIYNKMGEPFSSITNRKMNYTLATFFEAEGSRGEQYRLNVYRLLSIMRGHRTDTPISSSNTTLIYIKSANKDLSAGQMSYQAFQRGAFGWLYHILLVLAGEEFASIEEETARIEDLNKRYLPEDMEHVSDFILHETEERRNTLAALSKLDRETIRAFLLDMGTPGTFKLSYDLPCIFGRHCPRQGMSCLYCSFSIKTIHSVQIYKTELEKVINNLENTDDQIVIRKNAYLLFKILRVFQDLRREYGREYVDVFIDTDALKERIRALPTKELAVLMEAKNDKRVNQ